MKKLLTLLLIALLAALAFTCCTKKTEAPSALSADKGCYFHARVVELGENRVLAECTDGGNSGSIDVGTILYVNCTVTWDGYLHTLPDVNVDDEIRVVFDGRLMESDPPQVDAVEIMLYEPHN